MASSMRIETGQGESGGAVVIRLLCPPAAAEVVVAVGREQWPDVLAALEHAAGLAFDERDTEETDHGEPDSE